MGYPRIEKSHTFVCVCLFSPLEHASSMVKYLKYLQWRRSARSIRHDLDAESAGRGRKRRGMSTQGFDCHMLHLSTGREAGTIQSMVSFGIGCFYPMESHCSDYRPRSEGDNVLDSVRPSVCRSPLSRLNLRPWYLVCRLTLTWLGWDCKSRS